MTTDVKKLQRLSQLDPGQTLKSVHDDYKQAQRQIDIKEYDRIEVSYDINGYMSQVDYYQDRQNAQYEITLPSDSSGSLNSKYWLLNGPKDKVNYYVWYNTGGGVDPAIANRTGIEVTLTVNDPSEIVALATKLAIEAAQNYYQVLSSGLNSSSIKLTAMFKGTVSDPLNVSMPVLSVTELRDGNEVLLRSIFLEYDANGCLLSYDKVEIDVEC
jgi:hypothetical protein